MKARSGFVTWFLVLGCSQEAARTRPTPVAETKPPSPLPSVLARASPVASFSATTSPVPVGSVWPLREQPPTPSRWKPERDPAEEQACAPFAKAAYALSEAPTQTELATLVGCDAEASYYGIGTSIDFERARKCAFGRREPAGTAVMGGAEILMMIYANGRGVPQNFELAQRFACEMSSAPAELSGRLLRLKRAATTGSLSEPLDVCDDITSGYMMGYCAAHAERLAAVPRRLRRDAATRLMPPALVKSLEAAAARFFATRSSGEIDLMGTARAAFSIEEQARLEDELVVTLEHLRDTSFAPPHLELAPLERELARKTAALSRLRDDPSAPPYVVSPSGIRKTQKAWQSYRERLMALARQVRPVAELDDWRASILQSRLAQLRENLPEDR